ncbi:ubiquitinyl hydrolase 1 [Ancylostoma caninum]|uniref:Ubiquitin carboxyl-terminal hydrolase 36 n=1 Tax=Ancylostoma caninum TaxID=29170 RepID=A0A368GDA8_ANCCA|nr:ubiquitinyl hydrolase 1 [Ancylostoma caninum]
MSKWRSLPQLAKSSEPDNAAPPAEVPKSEEKKKERSYSVGGPVKPRVRKLSEKGKIEQRFPIFDPDMKDIWDFKNFDLIKNVKRASGIQNGGQHCFIISVMQMLTHTASFIRFIVDKHNHPNGGPVSRCFCCDLRKHLQRVLSTNVGSVNRMDWIFVYWKTMFGSEYYWTQEDAHEFLLKTLEMIDRCCSPASSSSDKIPKEPSPPMLQLFGFKLRYQLTCTVCGLCSVSYALHNDLALHLPRPGRFNVPPKMYNLIAMYMKSEVLEYACPDKKCKGKLARRTPFIFRAPSVLILQIKRFIHTEKKNGMRVQVEEHLSLKDFTYSQSDSVDYELTGVISHEGHHMSSGHYTALVRGFDRQFYLFNDDHVRPQRLLTANLCPYLIIYSRKGPQDRIFAPAKSAEANITNTKPLLPQKTNSVINARPLLPQRTNAATSPIKGTSGTGAVAALPKSPALTKTVLPRKPKLLQDGLSIAGSELASMRSFTRNKWFCQSYATGSDLEKDVKRGSENESQESQESNGDLNNVDFDVAFGSEDEKCGNSAKENEFTSSMDSQPMGFGVSKLTQANFPETSSNEGGATASNTEATQLNPEQLLTAINNTFASKESRRRGSLNPSHLLKGNGCYNCVLCNSTNDDSSKWKKRRLE